MGGDTLTAWLGHRRLGAGKPQPLPTWDAPKCIHEKTKGPALLRALRDDGPMTAMLHLSRDGTILIFGEHLLRLLHLRLLQIAHHA